MVSSIHSSVSNAPKNFPLISSASEVTTIWRYTNVYIIIIIIL